MRYLPNIITLLRFLLIIPVVLSLIHGHYFLALSLFMLAAISDGVDGFLARRYHWTSRLGAALDPAADKLMMLSVFITLSWLNRLPWWLLAIILFREAVIVLGACAYRIFIGNFKVTPTFISKCNTVVQIFLTILILFEFNYGKLNPWYIYLSMAMLGITTLVTLLHYSWVWGWRAWRESHKNRS